ncbi:uncharacterized protein LOC109612901 [Musca domestica]|uniref:Uncharacterized protein LOC109612901 n=1 Tax=Musca domestica TaxID=7370 RepID=A0A9J7IE44_MUSDO|nr:uncharacterized protein LOC109612901 [Musca domestica]
MIMFYFRIFMFAKEPSLSFILLSIYFGCLECLTIYTINFFFCGICYANCALHYVKEILDELEGDSISFRIHRLSQVFGDICKTTKNLFIIFQWQILSIMLAAMIALIALFFNLIILWFTSPRIFQIPVIVLTLQAAFINMGEIFVTAYVLNDMKECLKDIQRVLMELTWKCDFFNNKELDNVMDMFSLHLCVRAPQANLCGFFDFDMRIAIKFLQAMLIHLILLVQFHFRHMV